MVPAGEGEVAMVVTDGRWLPCPERYLLIDSVTEPKQLAQLSLFLRCPMSSADGLDGRFPWIAKNMAAQHEGNPARMGVVDSRHSDLTREHLMKAKHQDGLQYRDAHVLWNCRQEIAGFEAGDMAIDWPGCGAVLRPEYRTQGEKGQNACPCSDFLVGDSNARGAISDSYGLLEHDGIDDGELQLNKRAPVE